MPRHVREDAKKADEFIKSQGVTPDALDPDATPPADPPAEPPKAAAGEGGGVEDKPEPFATDYKQQYETLKGKYNSEVPQLTQQVRDQSDIINQLKAQMASLQTQVESGQAAGSGHQDAGEGGGQPSQLDIDTESIKQNFGEEFAQPFEQIVAQNAAQSAHIGRLEKLVEQLSTRTNESTYDQRIAALTSTLAKRQVNFAEVNTDPLFIDWLKKPDGFSGVVRQDILQQSVQQGDIQRAANIFFTYLSERQGGEAPNPTPNPLEQQVRVESNLPDQGQGRGQSAAWTEQQIAELYRAKRERRISQDEFKRLQDELFASPTIRTRQ